jgi:hypothetical protein
MGETTAHVGPQHALRYYWEIGSARDSTNLARRNMTKVRALIAVAAGILAACMLTGADQPSVEGPQFTADGKLIRPENYREWIFLSSGLGLTYGPLAAEDRTDNPTFDNVFVSRAAYKSFLNTGRWPDKTMFILEVRSSQSNGSINKGGHFQSGLVGVEAEVKDEGRFPEKWAFFSFGRTASTASAMPTEMGCHACHSQHGAVDNTFVQFYPTLLSVAKEKGTLRAEAPAR